jgi:hypothetical protein
MVLKAVMTVMESITSATLLRSGVRLTHLASHKKQVPFCTVDTLTMVIMIGTIRVSWDLKTQHLNEVLLGSPTTATLALAKETTLPSSLTKSSSTVISRLSNKTKRVQPLSKDIRRNLLPYLVSKGALLLAFSMIYRVPPLF